MEIRKLYTAISFFFVEERLGYLKKVLSDLPRLALECKISVITNAKDPNDHCKIKNYCVNCPEFEIVIPSHLGHPYLLPWIHLDCFRSAITLDSDITHFLYLEDDISLSQANIAYWVKARRELERHNLIPSFLRYEVKSHDSKIVSTDVTGSYRLSQLPWVQTSDKYAYVNLPSPYQGMYLLDRELLLEHLSGLSSHPDFGIWKIREKAAQGVTFINVPPGFNSRNLVGYQLDHGQVDPAALIHHLPNNYANNPKSAYGKIPIENLIVNNLVL